ncbi:hypothetical protein LZ016_06665 [Sphingomonas sp. SM33]|uniref:DUF308 domain-containing protein n=1 Tax=Sphingomonas telluris TaxID=2907998 RepID=A0ABS9VMY7_9SPHN|nr:hypothetical protein [Sphingomonas telluris]MCH8615782.1 hypothetical protein [Sphingomonas telluris]
MSDQARKFVIGGAGVLIILLALGTAALPLQRHLEGRLVVGWLLVAAGAIELVAAFARRIHRPSASVAGGATVLAGLRLVLDPGAGFFPVLNLVILWLVVRSAALAFAASRCKGSLERWFIFGAATDFLLAILLLSGLPIAVVVWGLFGRTSEIVATFAWVLAASFVATGVVLIAVAPAEASEGPEPSR